MIRRFKVWISPLGLDYIFSLRLTAVTDTQREMDQWFFSQSNILVCSYMKKMWTVESFSWHVKGPVCPHKQTVDWHQFDKVFLSPCSNLLYTDMCLTERWTFNHVTLQLVNGKTLPANTDWVRISSLTLCLRVQVHYWSLEVQVWTDHSSEMDSWILETLIFPPLPSHNHSCSGLKSVWEVKEWHWLWAQD